MNMESVFMLFYMIRIKKSHKYNLSSFKGQTGNFKITGVWLLKKLFIKCARHCK